MTANKSQTEQKSGGKKSPWWKKCDVILPRCNFLRHRAAVPHSHAAIALQPCRWSAWRNKLCFVRSGRLSKANLCRYCLMNAWSNCPTENHRRTVTWIMSRTFFFFLPGNFFRTGPYDRNHVLFSMGKFYGSTYTIYHDHRNHLWRLNVVLCDLGFFFSFFRVSFILCHY